MTTLIQQKSPNDCVLAAIAMAAGFEKWEDAWTEDDLQAVIKSKGVADTEPWLKRHGFVEWKHYRECYIHDDRVAHALLWKRRALISCSSLNNDGGSHMIFWDGARIWDPHEGHWDQGFQYFRHLSTLRISRAYIFDDTVARDALTAAVPQAPAEQAQTA